jgi:mycothione reductase
LSFKRLKLFEICNEASLLYTWEFILLLCMASHLWIFKYAQCIFGIMKEFDLIVIGAGSGLNVASSAADMGLNVAIVEEGPMGGTCLNRGCIPSKIIIHSADVAETFDRASLFGLKSKGYSVDFAEVTKRASNAVDKDAKEIEDGINETENMELFKATGKFAGERTVVVGSKKIKGKKILVAAGTRPTAPPIEGIKDVEYLTSDEALRLTKQPRSMVVLGGGFIACELAHFYGALGTKITMLQRSVLLRKEDQEIADAFTKSFSKKHSVILGYSTKSVKKKGKKIIITAESNDGKKKIIETDSLLVATGRNPNTDILEVEKAGIEVDRRGYIKTNEYLETTAHDVWALGDIAGKYLLKHSANLEAKYVFNNAFGREKKPVDYWPMPHAVFSSPQIAAVGYTEEELNEKGVNFAIGRYPYSSTGMGLALAEKDGFVKVMADRKTKKILGCHIIGPEAASIIHEVIVAMKNSLTTQQVVDTVHIHPAMSEVVHRAIARIQW